jgi:hypothetical protein
MNRRDRYADQSKYDKDEEQKIRREKEEGERQKSCSKNEEEAIKKEVDKKSGQGKK